MSGYFDIYAVAAERSVEMAMTFLDHFAPLRAQSSTDYVFADGRVLEKANDAIAACVDDASAEQAIYFRVLSPGVHHAMLFFNADGGLILGLSTDQDAAEFLAKLKLVAHTDLGFVGFEEPPPRTLAEFREISARRS